MSILIKGMEMPTNCEKCPFLDYEEGFCLASGVKDKSGWYESTLCPGGIKGDRHDDCPLVPVPPHRRLIDADALYQMFSKIAQECKQRAESGESSLAARRADYSKTAFISASLHVKNAPTIIPAEEGE